MFRCARLLPIGVLMSCVLLAASPADAQGNGRGNASGHNKRPSGSTGTTASSSGGEESSAVGSSAILPNGSGVRTFGSWLDDASLMGPGSGYLNFAVGYWRLPGFTEFDVPAFDVGVGLAPRVQVSASVPVYHASEPGGPVARGVGDLQLSTKIQLRDPAAGGSGRIGFAIIPMIEVSSVAPEPGASRMTWALPASVELQRSGWRAYGSAGYFSRGAIFTSGALEIPVTGKTRVTGTISQSRSIKRDDLSEAIGLSNTRTDVSGGATLAVSNTIAVFGSLGRTLSRQDPTRANLFIVAGLSMNFVGWTPETRTHGGKVRRKA